MRSDQDPSYRSPPQKKFSSPQRSSAMSGSKKAVSPTKNNLPFGKPVEIIKSKYLIFIQKLGSSFRISLCFAQLSKSGPITSNLTQSFYYRQTLLDFRCVASNKHSQCIFLQYRQCKLPSALLLIYSLAFVTL